MFELAQIGAMQIPNPLSPDRMTANERLDELAAILAAGVVRLKTRQSSRRSGQFGESCLDCLGEPSRHVTAREAAEART